MSSAPSLDLVWGRIRQHAGEPFMTKTGKRFRYAVSGSVLYPDRTNYALVRGEFAKVLEIWPVDGPGAINDLVRGPAYIWGILNDPRITAAAEQEGERGTRPRATATTPRRDGASASPAPRGGQVRPRAGTYARVEVAERIGLVGCVKTKLAHPAPAADLYTSELFLRRRAYVREHCDRWYILSAKHGLLDPAREIEPYEQTLKDASAREKQVWSRQVMNQLYGRFNSLRGLAFEIHAGHDYFGFGLREALVAAGAHVEVPTEHLRQGEQLAFYQSVPRRHGLGGNASSAGDAGAGDAALVVGIARELTQAFMEGAMDLSARLGQEVVGWDGVPEMPAAGRLREAGASDAEVRTFLTLTCAMDRARDAGRLWSAAADLFLSRPEVFDCEYVRDHVDDVGEALRQSGVSQRHGPDLEAWVTIAGSLSAPGLAPEVQRAVGEGEGDARVLLRKLHAMSPLGTPLFPFLKGQKVGPMWVRILAYPGCATLSHLVVVPVAVDTHVRRASEYLGVAKTQGMDLDAARPIIQEAWRGDVAEGGAVGPPGLGDTCAALDPALWFFGKHGCSHCEAVRQRTPIAKVCAGCNAHFKPDGA